MLKIVANFSWQKEKDTKSTGKRSIKQRLVESLHVSGNCSLILFVLLRPARVTEVCVSFTVLIYAAYTCISDIASVTFDKKKYICEMIYCLLHTCT